jgi:hypothetical protein
MAKIALYKSMFLYKKTACKKYETDRITETKNNKNR